MGHHSYSDHSNPVAPSAPPTNADPESRSVRWGHADMKKSASNDKLNGTPSIKRDVDGVLLAMCVECSASVYYVLGTVPHCL